jgi:hypothetical protein
MTKEPRKFKTLKGDWILDGGTYGSDEPEPESEAARGRPPGSTTIDLRTWMRSSTSSFCTRAPSHRQL